MARYAVSDIHGCMKSFQKILDKLSFNKFDKLYLLGDFINKGPDSMGVLDFVAKLNKNGYSIYCIIGNHDQKLLDVRIGNTEGAWANEEQKKITLKSFGVNSPHDIPEKYIQQLASMPYYLELSDCWLVHAGFFMGIKNPFLDTVSMLNSKNFAYDADIFKWKKIIHGHVPQPLSQILKTSTTSENIYKIDGGCVYYNSPEFGYLVAINLDNNSIVVQKNIDYPYPISMKSV